MSRIALFTLLAFLLIASGCSKQSGTGTSGGGGGSSSSSSSSGGSNNPDPNLPTTGIPDLDSFDLSIEHSSIEAFDYSGATTTLTIRLADRLNENTVPDGTQVFFSTEGGSIDQSCAITNGSCAVTLVGQNPRPPDGLVTIVAWTTGNESFLDQDSDGLYSDGDLFNDGDFRRRDLSEPVRDDNFNGVYDEGIDEFFDFDGDNVFDDPDGLFNGAFCSHPSECSTNQFLYIWDSLQVVFSSSTADITLNPDPVVPGPVTLTVTDINGNPMAIGTTITIETDNGEVDTTSFTVGTDFGTSTVLNVAGDGTSDTATFRVSTTSPERGLVTPYTTTFTD